MSATRTNRRVQHYFRTFYDEADQLLRVTRISELQSKAPGRGWRTDDTQYEKDWLVCTSDEFHSLMQAGFGAFTSFARDVSSAGVRIDPDTDQVYVVKDVEHRAAARAGRPGEPAGPAEQRR